MTTSVFDLPDRLAAKRDRELIESDESFFTRFVANLDVSITDLDDRLGELRRSPGGDGEAALARDLEIHRTISRVRTLRRFGPSMCLGRMLGTDGDAVYVGRLGLTGGDGHRLLLDWRSPAAEPFFAATRAHPMGLAARRRYRWTDGRITDYWDELFGEQEAGAVGASWDDQSAFIASLGAARSSRMRDVLGTIAADQDAVIRAGSRGALVVDGGPGTGKTVVALHRAAYLLYSEPRLGQRHGGVLFVGPSRPYLDYVADVLPGLGEDGVRICTLRDLVPEGAVAGDEAEPEVAALKAALDVASVIDAAVALYEEAPTSPLTVETPWAEITMTATDWDAAFAAAEPDDPHNDARERVWDALTSLLVERHPDGTDPEAVHAALRVDQGLVAAFAHAWPLLEATDLVGDLWTVPAYLRRCAPTLSSDDVRALQRADPAAWTTSDLPLLDAARRRLGDPRASLRRRRQRDAAAAQRVKLREVIDDLVAADDSELMLMTSLRHDDLQEALLDEADDGPRDPLAGPFAHVVVDEAQELTDAEWQMVLARCPSDSITAVGDRTQARRGFTETWRERLRRVGVPDVSTATLRVNYRTPAEIMAAAEPVIRAALPDANVPTSVRESGIPVRHASTGELDEIVADWLVADPDGVACVIEAKPSFGPMPRVRVLTPALAKGLEFDLVVVVEPHGFGDGVTGAVDRYVAMTRAASRLVVLDGAGSMNAP